MKTLVFDTGPIISLTVNNLLWLMQPLRKKFNGRFCIPEAVRTELIDKPFLTKKYKFESLQVEREIENKTLELLQDAAIQATATKLLQLTNTIFVAKETSIKICQYAELQVLAAALELKADAVVIDERVTRLLVEAPEQLFAFLQKRMHARVTMNTKLLREFQQLCSEIKIVRSVELVTIAYEHGLLDEYIVKLPNVKRALLESVLWGLKVHGTAVSEEEIEEVLGIERV